MKIYYMRDNHTFRALPMHVEQALEVIKNEFSNGQTSGMLFCEPKGSAPEAVHGKGEERWPEFEAEARAWLEEVINNIGVAKMLVEVFDHTHLHTALRGQGILPLDGKIYTPEELQGVVEKLIHKWRSNGL